MTAPKVATSYGYFDKDGKLQSVFMREYPDLTEVAVVPKAVWDARERLVVAAKNVIATYARMIDKQGWPVQHIDELELALSAVEQEQKEERL